MRQNPPTFDLNAMLHHAISLHQSGNINQAIEIYSRLLKNDSKNANLLFLLGSGEIQMGRTSVGLDLLNRSLIIEPNNSDAHYNIGHALQCLNRFDEAIKNYSKALKINPQNIEAYLNKGIALLELNQPQEAFHTLEKAVHIFPDYYPAYNSMGNALRALQKLDESLKFFEKAISIKSNYYEAYSNKAAALLDLKQFEHALECCETAIMIKANYPQAWSNKGSAYKELGRYQDALSAYQTALSFDSKLQESWINLGSTLRELKLYDQALAAYLKVFEIKSDHNFLIGTILHLKMMLCDWSGLYELHNIVQHKLRNMNPVAEPFGFQGISDSESDLMACAKLFANHSFPERAPPFKFDKHLNNKKIRIGYLCGELRNQATSILITELFELHNKDQFEIYAFDNGWDDGSEIRKRINVAFDKIINITRFSDLEAAKVIHGLGIEILINLNGYFGKNRQGIFSYRPSPIQVNYLGFPGTLGAKYIDYLIADKITIPESSKINYCEKIVYLPDSYQVNDSKRKISEKEFSRFELGLPDSGFMFCCFNNSYKITPNTFDSWMKILMQVENSVLWLLEDNETATKNILKEALKRGISTNRLIFAKRIDLPDHLARHRVANLFIDTLPYNAHTTASDALWAGLPVLTCMGNTFPGRVAASLLNAIGLPELITYSQTDYENLAIELATNSEKLNQIKNKLSVNRLKSALFNCSRFTKNIEHAYKTMHELNKNNLPPKDFSVNDLNF